MTWILLLPCSSATLSFLQKIRSLTKFKQFASHNDISIPEMSDDRDSETEQETTNDDKNKNDVGKEAAGVIRGVSRSIVRSPLVGRLPVVRSGASKGLLRQRLPVRQVAKVSTTKTMRMRRSWSSSHFAQRLLPALLGRTRTILERWPHPQVVGAWTCS